MALVEEHTYDAAPGVRYIASKVIDRDDPITAHRQTLKEGREPLLDLSWEWDQASELWFYTLSDAQEYAARQAESERLAYEEEHVCGS